MILVGLQRLLKNAEVEHVHILEGVVHNFVWESLDSKLDIDLITDSTLWHHHELREELVYYHLLFKWHLKIFDLIILLDHGADLVQDSSLDLGRQVPALILLLVVHSVLLPVRVRHLRLPPLPQLIESLCLILHTPPQSLLHPIFEPVGAVIVGGRKVIVFISDPFLQNDPSRPPLF